MSFKMVTFVTSTARDYDVAMICHSKLDVSYCMLIPHQCQLTKD